MDDAADRELMQRIAKGDASALERLYLVHRDGIARFLQRMGADSADIEDIVQEVFLNVWRAASRWEPKARVRTYLFTIARNAYLTHLRRAKPRELPPEPAAADPPTAAEREDDAAVVRRALETLDPDDRAIIAMVLEHGMSHAEAAQVLRMPVGTLKSRIHRAVARMREAMKHGR
jgi:RNA polymerase sigma-70 factor (ECF subfamily)